MNVLKQQFQNAQPFQALPLPTPQNSFSYHYQPCHQQVQQHSINSIQSPSLSISGPFLQHNLEISGQKSSSNSISTQFNSKTVHFSKKANTLQKPDNRVAFVEGLVGTFICRSLYFFFNVRVEISSAVINSIWPNHSISSKVKLLPIQIFIEEILRRSRTSFSTLQLALLYLLRMKQVLPAHIQQFSNKDILDSFDFPIKSEMLLYSVVFPLSPIENQQKEGKNLEETDRLSSSFLKCGKLSSLCGRRMFLSALVIAGKYLQDQTYSNRAWAKISGLAVEEVNQNETEFLKIIDYRLHVNNDTFVSWSQMLISWTKFNKMRKEMNNSKTSTPERSRPYFEISELSSSVNDIRKAEQCVKRQRPNSEMNGLGSPQHLTNCIQNIEKECKYLTQSPKTYLPSPPAEPINQPPAHPVLKELDIKKTFSSLLGSIVNGKSELNFGRKRKIEVSEEIGIGSSAASSSHFLLQLLAHVSKAPNALP
ncbi:hypothetical protein HK096_000995 [Nowakowskiella sp. JEL0078]|nr:hypothetical protein HK096_000995 [Nowakowskiella sp. JEL0078]